MTNLSKRGRQYLGLLCAVAAYYLVHEGAHLLYALSIGVFKGINFMGLGMQIDVYADRMTDTQLGLFCLVGSVATLGAAYLLTGLTGVIGECPSKAVKACAYYVTLALLLLDPLYLSVLCGFFGGGDMNGISLLVPELYARAGYGVLLAVNAGVFFKVVLPKYKEFF